MLNKAKPLICSRAFWLATAQALAGIFVIFGSTYPELETLGWFAIAKSLVDVYLRMQTTRPIGGFISTEKA